MVGLDSPKVCEMEKKDGQLVAHVPKLIELQVKQLSELEGSTPSEYVTNLIMADLEKKKLFYEFMKSVFEREV